jgi:plastocyanin
MRPTLRGIVTLSTALMLAACSGGTTPTTAPVNTAGPVATTAAEAPCADSTGTTVVATSVADNTWTQPLSAKVGDVITWTNGDTVPHRVALDDGSCSMSANIPGGGSKSLVFTKAGTYPFHCAVHSSMKGTITIS